MSTVVKAVCLLVALLSSQVPEFAQQYSQRIGGAADELATIVRHFDEDASSSGYDRPTALAMMVRNSERLVRDQAFRMKQTVARHDSLRQQQKNFSNGASFSATLTFLATYDALIAQRTFEGFALAIPLTLAALLFAAFGFIISFVVLNGAWFAARVASKRPAT